LASLSASPVRSFIVARLSSGIVSIIGVSLIVFLGTALLPGDAASTLLGQNATPETLDALRRELGLDQPLYLRYLQWVGAALTGDFGVSLSSGQPVASLILPRLGNSLILAGAAAVVVLPVAVGGGIIAAIRRDTPLDAALGAISLVLVSMPTFMVGYLLVYFFAVRLGLFPPLSVLRSNAGLGDWLYAIALPVLTLVMVAQAHIVKLTRAAILGVMASEYVLMAEVKGIPHRRIILRHALPNALSPILSICMMTIAYLIVDVIVVEVVFNYPGLGKLMVDAVAYRDLPMVQACGVLFSVIFISLNFTADLLAMLANPRQRVPRSTN
jgi:peptide/nickel transport system permease protein